MQSHHSSTPEITSETFSPNTMTSEFSYTSSRVNSNSPAPTSPPLVTKPTLEPLIEVTSPVSTDSLVPTNTNESQQSPVQHPAQRQLSIPKRKRPRDNYDRLIKVSAANGTTMVLQNETTPATREDTVIENIHSDETLEEGAKSNVDNSQQVSVPVAAAVRRHQSQRAPTATRQDLSHSPSLPLHIISSTIPAIDTASVHSCSPDPEYVEISDNAPIQRQDSLPHIYSHIDDPVKPKLKKPHTATGKTAKIGFGREYSYAAQHSLYSEKHKPEDKGVFNESAHHQRGFDYHRETTRALQEPGSQEEVDSYLLILPDTDTSSPDVPPSVSPIQPLGEEPHDDMYTAAVARDHTYSNLPQDYEVPIDKKTNTSNLNRHLRPASGLKRNKTLPATLPPADVQASSTREPFYTSLIRREVKEHDYDNPSPTHSQNSPGSSPRKPRLARKPNKQIVSGNTSCMDYTNISVWLSSEKKPHQSAAKSSTLPPGYTPLVHDTMTKNADYDYALPDKPTAVIVRKHTLL